MGMIEEEGLAAKRAARVFIEIGYYMDQVLIATVRGHENYGALVGAHTLGDTQSTMTDV